MFDNDVCVVVCIVLGAVSDALVATVSHPSVAAFATRAAKSAITSAPLFCNNHQICVIDGGMCIFIQALRLITKILLQTQIIGREKSKQKHLDERNKYSRL